MRRWKFPGLIFAQYKSINIIKIKLLTKERKISISDAKISRTLQMILTSGWPAATQANVFRSRSPWAPANLDSGIRGFFICGILSFGIQNTAQRIDRNPTKGWKPNSKFHWQKLESSTWNPESMALNPESNAVLNYLTWWGESDVRRKKIRLPLQLLGGRLC